MIDYKIVPLSPQAHLFQVQMTIQNPDPSGQTISLPAWIPGSYMIRDFARNIVTLRAEAGGSELTAEKLDKQTWRLSSCEGPVRVSYQVYAWDLSVRGAHLDTTHGYFNGTCVFMRVHGQEEQACLVEIMAPEGEQYSDWRVATTMTACGAGKLQFGTYGASDYADLIDHPVEMGTFAYAEFDVDGVPHAIAITGKHNGDMDRICCDLTRICRQHQKLFGGLPDMERYLFQVMAVGEGYGGLEHRSSTSLICRRSDLPDRNMEDITEGYRQFLGLCSHEYFHLWNVKRIRPQRLKEADLGREAYTTLLWAFEGITSYYDDLALARSEVIDHESYLELLARTVTRVRKGSGRLRQTVAESSFDAWTKFYKQDENAPNAIVSYYTKGALIAFALDQKIRQGSGNRLSLDDVMRELWHRFGARDIGLQEGDVERTVADVTGLDLSEFFDSAVRGYEDLDLESGFSRLGIGFRLRAASDMKDQGGLRKGEEEPPAARLSLGVVTRYERGESIVANVFDGGAAQNAGIAAGDTLVAIEGLRVTESNLDNLVGLARQVTPIRVTLFRRDELMEFFVTPLAAPKDTCDLWFLDSADDQVLRQRELWLSGDC